MLTRLGCLLTLGGLASPVIWADQLIVARNNGSITATAKLNFNIAISKFVLLRVGNANATQSSVTFTLAVNPAVAGTPGNSLAYSGSAVPAGLVTTVATTNPTSSAGVLNVSAFSNVTGTTLTCSLTILGTDTPFATGTTAAGVPGQADIKVASLAGGVQHPGTDLSACNGSTSTALTSLSTLTGSFTYSTAYSASALKAGNYGNIVTYTATTP